MIGLSKLGKPSGIAGTVHPLAGFCPVGDGQFEELGTLPIEVGLTLSARTDHKIDAFLMRDGFRRREASRLLSESIPPCRHS